MSDKLILEIEVPDFNVDGVAESLADLRDDGDEWGVHWVVVNEWMRDEVGVTFVSLPGEKCLNSEFEVHSRVCRIVGARIEQEPQP